MIVFQIWLPQIFFFSLPVTRCILNPTNIAIGCDFNDTNCMTERTHGGINLPCNDNDTNCNPVSQAQTTAGKEDQPSGITPPSDQTLSEQTLSDQTLSACQTLSDQTLVRAELTIRPNYTYNSRAEDKSNEQKNERPSQQEDDGNYCPKNDNGCDNKPDGPEPSRCSDLKGGCKNFIVCDENDGRYDKNLLPKDTPDKNNDSSVSDKGDSSDSDNGDSQIG